MSAIDDAASLPHQVQRMTMSVTEAGARLGIGKNAAYAAAGRGEIPVIRLGKRMLVPISAFEQMLAVRSKAQMVAAELERRLRISETETT
jgi:excisionase family DNA binding protein